MINKILLAVLMCPLLVSGQKTISETAPKLIARIPFKQYSGGVMVVRAAFENIKDSLNFILDTGSGGISLDSSTCAAYNLVGKKSDTTITGIGGKRKVSFLFHKTLHFPGLKIDSLNFHINNYEVLTSVYGEKIDGIIGYNFFSRYIVHINFDSHHVAVYTRGKMQYPNGGHTLHPAFTSLPIQYAQVKDERKIAHHFYFDTGAGLCFLMSDRFVKDSNILLKRRKPVFTQAEGMAGKVQMRLSVVKELKLGPYRFKNVPTYLYKDDYNVLSYPFSGGLLGNELLRRFNMTINYGEREIHLMPNSHFKEVFDYAYTGMAIYYQEGKIMIEDIIDESPAQKAGLQIGDEIFGVGNNLSKNIQQYKNMLQVANQKVRLLVIREGQILEINLKTASILR